MTLDWTAYPDFSEAEFVCRCGCGDCDMDPGFMEALQELRDDLDFPLVISSGYRCPAHNCAVSSTGEDGPHTTGKACDVRVAGEQAWVVLALINSAFTGIGVSQTGAWEDRFIHLDTLSGDGRPTVWSY